MTPFSAELALVEKAYISFCNRTKRIDEQIASYTGESR